MMHEPILQYSLVPVILASLLTVQQATAQTADQIQMTTGARLDGQVTAATPTEVTIDVRGSKRAVAVNEIKHVIFADDPAELRAGRARILVGKYESGLADLKKVNPAEVQREIVRRDLQFYLAYSAGKVALSIGGDKAAATKSMLAFVRAAPTSHHFFQAAELLGDLSVAQGDFGEAIKYYGAISSKAPWPEYKMAAMMAEARALISQGDFAAAQQKYETVAAAKSETKQAKRQILFAQVGRARCLAETGSVDEAITMIEDIIDKDDASDTELFGRAYNALGDCLLKADKPKDALMAYLHVDVLFYSDPEIHAEALYHLTQLWEQVKNNDRSIAARKLLDQRYGGSIWANR